MTPPSNYRNRLEYFSLLSQSDAIVFVLYVEEQMTPEAIASLIERSVEDVVQAIKRILQTFAHYS